MKLMEKMFLAPPIECASLFVSWHVMLLAELVVLDEAMEDELKWYIMIQI